MAKMSRDKFMAIGFRRCDGTVEGALWSYEEGIHEMPEIVVSVPHGRGLLWKPDGSVEEVSSREAYKELSKGLRYNDVIRKIRAGLTGPEFFEGQRMWVWRCQHCNGWHATLWRPEAEECYGLDKATLAEVDQHIRNAARKGSKRAAWHEAEAAAELLGIETCPADQARGGRWPDLDALRKRLKAVSW
jgi:hypothetical protein